MRALSAVVRWLLDETKKRVTAFTVTRWICLVAGARNHLDLEFPWTVAELAPTG